jgi:hypothetical protein
LSDVLEVNGLPLDLTGSTVYGVFRSDTGATRVRKPAQVTDAPNGAVRIQLDNEIVGTIRRWRWEWEVNLPSGDLTFPENDYHLLTVMADLG